MDESELRWNRSVVPPLDRVFPGATGFGRSGGDGHARVDRGSWMAVACVFVGLLLVPTGAALGQWVESPGEGWIDVTLYHQDTRELFWIDGERQEFFSEGHAVNTSLFFTVAGGILPGVDGWMQLPYHRLRYDDTAGERLRSGLGDSRFYLRASPLRLLGSSFPLSIRGGVKVPVGDFAVAADVIPLGDGQTDWELMLELGHSFHPLPLYVSGWVGYRWRKMNEESLQDFGDERFFLVQGGGEWRDFGAQVVVEGWDGATPIIEGIALPNAERRMLQLTPNVSYPVGPGEAKVGARLSLAGKNLPAGTALVLGYFTRWSF